MIPSSEKGPEQKQALTKRQRMASMCRWILVLVAFQWMTPLMPKIGENPTPFIAGSFVGIFLSVVMMMLVFHLDHD